MENSPTSILSMSILSDADTERFNITVEVRDTYVAAPSVTCNNRMSSRGRTTLCWTVR